MSSEEFFQSHPVFTHEEYAQSRGGGSPRTVDSLLRKHIQGGRIARVRRGLYVAVPAGGATETVDPYLVATKAVEDAVVSHHAAREPGRLVHPWNLIVPERVLDQRWSEVACGLARGFGRHGDDDRG